MVRGPAPSGREAFTADNPRAVWGPHGSQPRPKYSGPRRAGYSLSNLFVLTALIAIVVALLATSEESWKSLEKEQVVLALVCGGVAGCLLGAYSGSQASGNWRGRLIGMAVGLVTGPAAAFLMLIPSTPLIPVLIGCGLLIGLAAAIRWGSQSAEPEATVAGSPTSALDSPLALSREPAQAQKQTPPGPDQPDRGA